MSPDSEPHRNRLYQLVDGEKFKGEYEAYKSIMRRILALAEECDGSNYPLYTLTVRGSDHFGLYKVLLRLYPAETSIHPVDAASYLEDRSFENADRVMRN